MLYVWEFTSLEFKAVARRDGPFVDGQINEVLQTYAAVDF